MNKFTRFLTGLGQGLTNPKGDMGDFQHASRLFVDNTFSRAPRTKFLFHVYFDINPNVRLSPAWMTAHRKEVGMLVKTADLPKFTLQTEVKNQYNKKKIVYKDMTYDPVNISFHDDNAGIVNALWAQYMSYISPDRSNPGAAYDPKNYNIYRKSGSGGDSGLDTFRYGLDRDGYTTPFFRSITIYTMSRRRFNSYTLVNPMIQNWTSGGMDYAQGNGMNDMSMTLQYETVFYGYGTVTKGVEPKGFAELHYDSAPSPLSIFGGGTSSLFGAGGLFEGIGAVAGGLAGADDIFPPTDNNLVSGGAGFFSTAIAAINTYKNFRSITADTLKQEAANILLVPNRLANSVSGLPGISFPR
jgi:hypothetical protein